MMSTRRGPRRQNEGDPDDVLKRLEDLAERLEAAVHQLEETNSEKDRK
jgi:hypothetical protein